MNYLTLLKGMELFRKLPGFDEDYKKFVLDRRQTWEDIDRIAESDVKETMIEFLKRWKIRNVNRIDPAKLKEVLKGLNEYFEVLRNKSLIDLNFNEEINVNGQKKEVSEIVKEYTGNLLNVIKALDPHLPQRLYIVLFLGYL